MNCGGCRVPGPVCVCVALIPVLLLNTSSQRCTFWCETTPTETSLKNKKKKKNNNNNTKNKLYFCNNVLNPKAITLSCQTNFRMICILAAFTLWCSRIVDLLYSVCKRAWWQVETSEWFGLRERDFQTAPWLFVLSLTELCSELQSINHYPSVPISSCLPSSFFNHSIKVETRMFWIYQ